jgi:hypothetical protein
VCTILCCCLPERSRQHEENNEKLNALRIACLLSGIVIGFVLGVLTPQLSSLMCLEVIGHDQLPLLMSPVVVIVVIVVYPFH